MTKEQISQLLNEGKFLQSSCKPELIETHISWVFLCNSYVYKIKKPIQYSFLDFSTVEKRKYYCEREIELNKRLTENIYLDVQPVTEASGSFIIGSKEGNIIDYAVRMRKIDRSKQMDVLLLNNKVTIADIKNLAEKIAHFHNNTEIIHKKNFLDVKEKFNDLAGEKKYLQENLNKECYDIIERAVDTSNIFLEKNKTLLATRLSKGFFRDCHGDLHSRNIFLLPSPQPFDCIEFNDDFRQIDVLNEVAFLCMDLDAFGRHNLSDLFINYYNDLFPSITNDEEKKLFIYYKSYRSNIRTKVNSLRTKDAKANDERKLIFKEVDKYLRLMDGYIKELRNE